MKRSSQGKRLPVVVVVVAAALWWVGCTGNDLRSEVPTRSGRTLNCPDELIAYSAPDQLAEAIGSDEPAEALDAYLAFAPQPGSPDIEEETTDEVIFVLTDTEDNRLARVGVTLSDAGWFVTWTEQCGTSP